MPRHSFSLAMRAHSVRPSENPPLAPSLGLPPGRRSPHRLAISQRGGLCTPPLKGLGFPSHCDRKTRAPWPPSPSGRCLGFPPPQGGAATIAPFQQNPSPAIPEPLTLPGKWPAGTASQKLSPSKVPYSANRDTPTGKCIIWRS